MNFVALIIYCVLKTCTAVLIFNEAVSFLNYPVWFKKKGKCKGEQINLKPNWNYSTIWSKNSLSAKAI